MFKLTPTLCLTCLASTVAADETFVTANVLDILYHELGHAIIDVEGLLLFGKEETAADFFANVMMHIRHGDALAATYILDVAAGYAIEAEWLEEPEPWGTHDTYWERHYNALCLLYGSNPRRNKYLTRRGLLPSERAEYCEEEFEIAFDSWSIVLEDLASASGSHMRWQSEAETDSLAQRLLASEVAALNATYRFSAPLLVSYEYCDEANAYYDPEGRAIIFCAEYETALMDMAPDR